MRRSLPAAALATAILLSAPVAWSAEDLQAVSLVRLIAEPQRYDGKLVSVEGHFDGSHFEQCRLFLSAADTKYYVRANSVGVHWPGCLTLHPERLHVRWRYVNVVGVFRFDPGHGWDYSRIDDVRSIEPLLSQGELRRKLVGPKWIRYWPWFPLSLPLIPLATFVAYRLALRSSRR